MSLEAYIWAANLPLSRCNGTPFRVLLQLADRADQMGYGAYPSIGTIADTLECSTRTVQRALLELRASGLIRYGDQRYVAHIPADRRPTVYDVVTPALLAKEHLVKLTNITDPIEYNQRAYLERGDNYVTPSPERGDNYGPDGVTTVVAQTVLKPSYQDTPRHLTLVTARESEGR